MILEDSIIINVSPDKVFDWFFHFAENYQAWHHDHVKAEWVKGRPLEVGCVMCAEEYLHGELHKIKFRLTEIIPNQLIAYQNLFPLSLLSPGGTFQLTPLEGQGTKFTATLTFRMGKLLAKLAREQVAAFKEHMQEESRNLKQLLERVK